MGRRLVASSLVLAVAVASPVPASAPGHGLRLQTLTLQEVSDAQAAGIGCSWSPVGHRGMRFAAADGHAVVKLNGRLVRLRPARAARDMFPFTFDRWTGDGVSVALGKSVSRRSPGNGTLEGSSSLRIERNGHARVLTGRIECGD